MKGLVAGKSKIDSSFKMFVIYSDHKNYASDFAPIFKSHGLGILMPGKKEIYIDGEGLKGLSYDHLLAIQAHEIAHYRLKHRGTYSKKQELEADVEGHKILVDGNYTKGASILRKRIKDHYGKSGLKMLDENKENNMIKLKDLILREGKDWEDPKPENIADGFISEWGSPRDWKDGGGSLADWMRDDWGPNTGISRRAPGFDDCYDEVEWILNRKGYENLD